MTFLKTLLTAIGMFALLGTAVQASSLEQIKAASFELYRDDHAICSGQFISKNEFLTAAHCLKDNKDHKYFILVEGDGITTKYDLLPKIVSVEYDAASLTLVSKTAEFPFVDVADKSIKLFLGQDVILAGFPDVEDYFVISNGVYQGTVPMPEAFKVENGEDQYSVLLYAIPGSSGSGLYTKTLDGYFLIGTEHGGPDMFMNFTSTIEGVLYVK